MIDGSSSPRALYIHIPFCVSKCRYCDFASEVSDRDTVERCLAAIREELKRRADDAGVLDSVYIGGGTPSVLTAEQVAHLIDTVKSFYDISDTAEVTIEANPGDCTREKANVWRDAGVNRVSVGGQSFDADVLEFLGRRHSVDDIYCAIEALRDASITNLSIDLIYAVPGQTMDSWKTTLEKAVERAPSHVSSYGLTYETGTPLSRDLNEGRVRPLDEDTELDMYRYAIEFLQSHGLRHYEISNFAQPSRESRHNMVYWRNGLYIGAGPSAVSYVDGLRTANHRTAAEYIEAIERHGTSAATTDRIPTDMEMAETCIQRLRLSEGIILSEFRERFAKEVTDVYANAIETLVDAGLIEVTDTAVRHTPKGRELANETAERFLPSLEKP